MIISSKHVLTSFFVICNKYFDRIFLWIVGFKVGSKLRKWSSQLFFNPFLVSLIWVIHVENCDLEFTCLRDILLYSIQNSNCFLAKMSTLGLYQCCPYPLGIRNILDMTAMQVRYGGLSPTPHWHNIYLIQSSTTLVSSPTAEGRQVATRSRWEQFNL